MITYPHLAIAINDMHQVTMAHVRDQNDTDPFTMELALFELNADGLATAIERVGHWTLATLSHWYPAQWSRFPNLKFSFKAEADLDLISNLISKATTSKQKAFIPAIDLLIAKLIKDDPLTMENVTIQVWPDIRAQLEKYPA